MLSKKEIESMKIGLWNIRAENLRAIECSLADTEDKIGWQKEVYTIDNAFKYIEELEQQNKALGKGQHSLMESRRKWKRRYYAERRKRKEADKSVIQIYEDYQDIGRIAFEYSDKIDLIKEKLKKMRKSLNKDGFVGYADDITDMLVELKEDKQC